MKNEPSLMVLTSPGSLSEDTAKILNQFYSKSKGALILCDGLTIKVGTFMIDEKQPFYICCPVSVKKKIAKKFIKMTQTYLKRAGFKDFVVIFLPEGIQPSIIIY